MFWISGFQPGGPNHQSGCEPFMEGSQVGILCTQLYYILGCGMKKVENHFSG